MSNVCLTCTSRQSKECSVWNFVGPIGTGNDWDDLPPRKRIREPYTDTERCQPERSFPSVGDIVSVRNPKEFSHRHGVVVDVKNKTECVVRLDGDCVGSKTKTKNVSVARSPEMLLFNTGEKVEVLNGETWWDASVIESIGSTAYRVKWIGEFVPNLSSISLHS